eukprot:519858-Amphidinium_carterae.1
MEHRRNNYSLEPQEWVRNESPATSIANTVAECKARFRSHSRLEVTQQCVNYSTKKACEHHLPYCSWEAQEQGRCGISRSFVIMALAGEHADNPF